jgi:D-erythronate 2-dehydrogenase
VAGSTHADGETGDAVASVLITGGAGFLGARPARRLPSAGSLEVAGSKARSLSPVTLADRAPLPRISPQTSGVAVTGGDLSELLEPALARRPALAGADVIFHLAAAVSAECEADFDLRMRWP